MDTLNLVKLGTGTKVHIGYHAFTYCTGSGRSRRVQPLAVLELNGRTNLEAALEARVNESDICKACFGIK